MNKQLYKLLKNDRIANTAAEVFQIYRRMKLQLTNFQYEKAENPSISKKELLDYNRHRKFTVDKNICFAPKKSMLFSFDGNVYLCCENKGESIGHINQDRLHDIWFGKKRLALDKKINSDYNLNGGCENCNYKIHHQNYSTVQAQNFDLYTLNRSDYPARLEFEIHNTCNLECVMCSAIYSSSIQANRNQLPATPMIYNDDFIAQLDEFIPHLASINLLGGEPTLIKPYYSIIERIQAVNPGCFIHLQTNATTLNRRFRKLLEKKGGNFEIGISMDALQKDLAEKIRVNMDFDKFMEHVSYYTGLYQKGQIKLTINTCPMPLNWRELIPIIEFCNARMLPIFICIVNAPFYNSFLSTTADFISMVHGELAEAMQNLPRNSYYEKNNYRQLEDFLHMLYSWLGLALEYRSNRDALIHNSVEDLYSLFEERLFNLMIYKEKDLLIREVMEYTRFVLSTLDEADIKELLITLLNVGREPIIVTSDREYLRWAREYVNTLAFSYARRITFS